MDVGEGSSSKHVGEERRRGLSSTEHDKSPASFFWWLQTVRDSILSGRTERLDELQNALIEKRKSVLLTSNESLLLSALSIFALAQSVSGTDAPCSDAAALSEAIELHREQTEDTASSSLNAQSFMAYASLLVHLYCAFHEIQFPDDESQGDDDDPSALVDVVYQWTGIRGAPVFRQDGRYDSFGALRIPTRHQVLAAGLEVSWDQVLSVEPVRNMLNRASTRIAAHMQCSQAVWSLYCRFEMAHLSTDPSKEDLDRVRDVFLARLAIPHSQYDRTAQMYSTFVSRWMPSSEYEESMAHAYTILGPAKSIAALCEPYEEAVRSSIRQGSRSSATSWLAWKPYVTWASHTLVASSSRQRGTNKSVVLETLVGIFERALADCGLPSPCAEAALSGNGPPLTKAELAAFSRERGNREKKQEQIQKDDEELRTEQDASCDAWMRYLSFLDVSKASAASVIDVCSRGAKALPSKGALLGQILRSYCRLRRSADQIDDLFSSSLANPQLCKDVKGTVDLLLARIDVERDQSANKFLLEGRVQSMPEALLSLLADDEIFMNVFGTMTFAQDTLVARNLIDASCTLELLISDWCLAGGMTTAPLAEGVWESAMKQQPDNGDVWLYAARYFVSRCELSKAKETLRQGIRRHGVSSEKKVQLAEELMRLYRVMGSVQDVDWAIARVTEERERSWTDYYTAYASTQTVPAAANTEGTMIADVSMSDDVDANGKRKNAGEEESAQDRVQFDQAKSPPRKLGKEGEAKVQRDRENCSVLVDKLPFDATENDIFALFKDCGDILEIIGPKCVDEDGRSSKTPKAGQPSTALVEFVLRESIPAARSRHRKPIRSSQVDIRLGYECTLFVTNFPPSYDSDAEMRMLFKRFGRIFDVRWPSKKFAASRRFCYVVFCNVEDAQQALALHNIELTDDDTMEENERKLRMQVLLSDPHRKKARSDAFNDDKELFINGLPRAVSEADLSDLFGPGVQHVRIPKHPDGRNRGIAYVDMTTILDAQRALGKAAEVEGGGYRINGKLLTVSLVDRRKQQSHHGQASVGGDLEGRLGIERRSRCLFVRGLPDDAQEAIIQQVLERVFGSGTVKRIEWTAESASRGQATVEFQDTATAGRVALSSTVVHYDDDHPLHFSTLESRGAAALLPTSGEQTDLPFVPRQSSSAAGRGRGRGRGRGGVGFVRQQQQQQQQHQQKQPDSDVTSQMEVDRDSSNRAIVGKSKDQDAFRQMLFKGT